MNGQEQSEIFSSLYRTGLDTWTHVPYEDIAASLLPRFSDAIVLDIGSGRGTWANRLVTDGNRVIGIEIVPELVEQLNQDAQYRQIENRMRFVNVDFLSRNFSEKSFDAVTDLLTFQHLPPRMWGAYVTELAALLPTDGLYLNVSLSRATPRFLGMEPSNPEYEHGYFSKYGLTYYFFTPAEIKKIFEKEFQIVAQHSQSFDPLTDPADKIVLIFTLMKRLA